MECQKTPLEKYKVIGNLSKKSSFYGFYAAFNLKT